MPTKFVEVPCWMLKAGSSCSIRRKDEPEWCDHTTERLLIFVECLRSVNDGEYMEFRRGAHHYFVESVLVRKGIADVPVLKSQPA